MLPDKKRKKLAAPGPAPVPVPVPRLIRVRSGKKKRKGASLEKQSPEPVYMVLAHGVEEEPTHSVIEVAAGAAVRSLPNISGRGMSFVAVGARIVCVGVEETTIYDPKTSTKRRGPRLFFPKVNPVLISDGDKLFALSRTPAVVRRLDFEPWFFVLDDLSCTIWRCLPSPPIFQCRLNPLEYRDPPKVRVAAYALVDSHILLSVQQDKGTCAFDLDTELWEMVHDKNLPFNGQAFPLGDHRFVACSEERGGPVVLYHMVVGISGITGKKELTILELQVAYKHIVPGQLLCAMGKGSFSSFDFRSIASPGKLYKARIVHRTYSQVETDDAEVDSVKQDRQIYKLRDPDTYLAHPSWPVAALTI